MFQDNQQLSTLVSVVIPAHNEALGIEHAVNEIQHVLDGCGYEFAYELIIVDDGSRDGTFQKVLELGKKHKGLKGMQLSRNFGKESALLAGLKAARGDAVITIDADLQHPPTLIPELLAKWKEGFKVVHAVKRDRYNDSLLVRWRAALFNNLLARLSGIDVRHSSDFKLLDRIAVNAIARHLPETRRFYRGLADWVGFEQTTIPFSVVARNVGHSKWSMIRLLDCAITAVVSFTAAPLRVVTLLGLITLIFAAGVAAEALWSWFKGQAVSGFATTIITLLILGSFIMISMGILGEYIAKIYDEIKRRPSYLVTSRCGFEDANNPTDNENPG